MNRFQIERELQRIDEEVIKTMFNDVKILRDNRYSQANELHRRCTSVVVAVAFVVVEMLLLMGLVVVVEMLL